MKRTFKWLTTFTALAATLLIWGCDEVGNVVEPQLEPSPMVVMSKSGQRYVVAWEKNPEAASVSAKIGPKGGVLGLGKHALWVSEGAVSATTEFTITRAPESALRVKLTAGKNNSVGAKGFDAPVLLGLSMENAQGVPEGSNREDALILYLRSDGVAEELASRVYGHLAIARLPHFSDFALGWP